MKVIHKLGQGRGSVAYLCQEDGREFVTLYPINRALKKWLRGARKTIAMSKKIPDVKNVNIARAKLLWKDKGWQLEENYIKGLPFDLKKFQKMPLHQQRKSLKDFARFIFELNQTNVSPLDEEYGKKLGCHWDKFCHKLSVFKRTYFRNNLFVKVLFSKKAQRTIKHNLKQCHLSNKECEKFYKLWNELEHNPEIFQYYGPCYGDVHTNNIFYDLKTHQWGIIDLEGIDYCKSIYVFFSKLIPVFGMENVQFLSMEYNNFSRRHANKINLDFNIINKLFIISFMRIITSKDQIKKLKELLQ